MRVLLVEDEARVGGFVARGPRQQTMPSISPPTASKSSNQAEVNECDIVILDALLRGQWGARYA